MEKKWDGKTKGSLWGYRFFTSCIKLFGVLPAYFFCYFVAGYFFLFFGAHRKNLMKFYTQGMGFTRKKARSLSARNFNTFGRVLIDRIALKTFRKKEFTFDFDNEKVLVAMNANGKGGFLFSGHLGNWENAGNLIAERITSKINILMLDQEVEKVKQHLALSTEASKFNLIPLKDDMSHLVLVHQALKRNELVALHADRYSEGQKTFELPFLNRTAKFPAGPFIMAHKFKVPITFVFAFKDGLKHYALSATDPLENAETAEQVAEAYVSRLEHMVRIHPEQWFNYFDFYDYH